MRFLKRSVPVLPIALLAMAWVTVGCGDKSGAEAGATDSGESIYEPSPIAPAYEPSPVPLSWVFHDVGNPAASDPVGDALEAGEFPIPRGGTDSAAQVWWDPLEVAEDGVMASPGGGTLRYTAGYAIVELDRYYFLRADSVSRVHMRGLRQLEMFTAVDGFACQPVLYVANWKCLARSTSLVRHHAFKLLRQRMSASLIPLI